jgi:hypothetical protein
MLCTPVNERTFRKNISPLSSGLKNKPSNKPAGLCLPPALTLVSCSAYFSTLNMEAKCCSETSVDFQRTTRRYIPEDVLFLTTAVRILALKMEAVCCSETSTKFRRTTRRYNPEDGTLHNHRCEILDPEDGGNLLLRNIGSLSTDYTALYPRRWYSS